MATAAAAIVMMAQQDVVSHFMTAKAVTPDHAIAYAPADRLKRSTLDRYRRAGVIVETAPSEYYLDTAAYAANRRRDRRTVALTVGAFVAATAALIAFA